MSLAPKLRKISVSTKKLLLDPNNPRLFTSEEERVPPNDIPDPGVQEDTRARLRTRNDKFRIDELIESIRTNSYVPEAGGYIFVRSLAGTDYYLVLEGNRRVISLRELLVKKAELDSAVASSIEKIDVLELIDDIPESQIQAKISYLLGTCHHGSHKDWSPFAQARGIYERYLEQTGQDKETFKYEKDEGEKIASLLSITEKEVRERLTVFRAMAQLAGDDRMKSSQNGNIISSYYSLIGAAVFNPPKNIKTYIPKDPDRFILEPEAIDKLINLCNFDGTKFRYRTDKEGRLIKDENGRAVPPPMRNVKQWGYLEKILGDEDVDARAKNLQLVEEEHQSPEEVWARRRAELTEMTWKRWLQEVRGILSGVRMEDDFDSSEAREVVNDLHAVITSLQGEENA